jgi:hypothetical protein
MGGKVRKIRKVRKMSQARKVRKVWNCGRKVESGGAGNDTARERQASQA